MVALVRIMVVFMTAPTFLSSQNPSPASTLEEPKTAVEQGNS